MKQCSFDRRSEDLIKVRFAIVHQVVRRESSFPPRRIIYSLASVSVRFALMRIRVSLISRSLPVYSLLDWCGSSRLGENHFSTAQLR